MCPDAESIAALSLSLNPDAAPGGLPSSPVVIVGPMPDPRSGGARRPACLLGLCDAVASQRPSVAPSAWSRVGSVEGCDHADGTPAACLVAGRADLEALPEGARYDIVRRAPRGRVVDPAQCQTRHPVGAGFSACPGRLRSRISIRLGGHCGGGLPACPSVSLKEAGRFRESAGCWAGLDARFLAPSAPAFWTAATLWRLSGPASHHRRGRALEAGRAATTPMGRRWPASLPGEPTSRRSPREPGMTLCGERREAGWSIRHNVKPGTPSGRGFLRVLVGFGFGSPSGWADIVGAGFQPAHQCR